MNKTITVNISGLIFNIEEQAYEKLGRYLSTIRRYFSDSEGGEEIMSDIESRVAELFQEKISPQKQVINLRDVEDVIATMGQPEEYVEADPDADEEREHRHAKERRSKRRVFRDPDNRVLGGVCSGVSAYFGWDPLILRALFVVLLIGFGIGIIPYIILWIIIPKARTTAEKLEMRGEPVTVENIGKSVSDSFKDVKDGFSKFTRDPGKVRETEAYRSTRSGAEQFFSFLGQLLVLFVKVLVGILGFLLIIAGVSGLLLTIAAILGSSVAFGLLPFTDLMPSDWSALPDVLFNSSLQSTLMSIGTILLFGIPMVASVYIGVRMLFKVKGRDALVALSLVVLWLLGLGATTWASISVADDFKNKAEVVDVYDLPLKGDTLNLAGGSFEVRSGTSYSWSFYDEDMPDMLRIKSDSIYLDELNVDVLRNLNSDKIQLRVQTKARGGNAKTAHSRAEGISYKYTIKDSSRLFIDPKIGFHTDDKIRGQEVNMSILLPAGKAIYFEPSSEKVIYDVENVSNTYDGDMISHTWEMRREGLTCLDCPGWENDTDENENNAVIKEPEKPLPEDTIVQ